MPKKTTIYPINGDIEDIPTIYSLQDETVPSPSKIIKNAEVPQPLSPELQKCYSSAYFDMSKKIRAEFIEQLSENFTNSDITGLLEANKNNRSVCSMLNKITKFKRKQEKAAAAQQKRQNCLLTIVGKLETPEKITAFLDTLNKIAELRPRQFEIKKKLYKPTDWDIEVAGVLTRSPGKHPLVAEWSSHKNRAC